MMNDELKRRIIKLFPRNVDFANKLIFGDVEAIQSLVYLKKINANDIILAYNNNKVDELYNNALREIEINKLYHELCLYVAENKHYNNRK